MTTLSSPPGYKDLLGRILEGRSGLQQVWFDAAVLDKYRGRDDYQLLRTDSAGQLRRSRTWTVDFGIVEDESGRSTLLHLPAESLGARLPAAEREHWQQHAVSLPVSEHFITMQLHPGACIDDGELRTWGDEND